MPTLSIIVPVYKVEQYLPRCIDSILAQTFTDFELILIDDGSPDNCGAICDDYAHRDSRIQVLHNENGGPSAARNAGLDVAKGRYLGFVDSDDCIHPRMYELMIDAIKTHDVDIVQCGYTQFSEDNVSVEPVQNDIQNCQIILLTDLLGHFLPEDRYRLTAAMWCKIYKREVWQHIRFPLGMFFEDSYVHLPLLAAAQQIALLSQPLYFYFLRPSSTMHSNYAFWWAKDGYALCEHDLEFFRKRGNEQQAQYALNDLLGIYCKNKLAICLYHRELRPQFKEIARRFRKEFWSILFDPKICRMGKTIFLMLYIRPRTALSLCKKYFPEWLYPDMR